MLPTGDMKGEISSKPESTPELGLVVVLLLLLLLLGGVFVFVFLYFFFWGGAGLVKWDGWWLGELAENTLQPRMADWHQPVRMV